VTRLEQYDVKMTVVKRLSMRDEFGSSPPRTSNGIEAREIRAVKV
jgi:hypothetical protein